MKRTAYMTLAAVALVLMALVPAYAQKTSATVNVPFTFTVDDVRMPAGEYLITSPSEKVISIQRVGGSEAKVTLTTSGSAARKHGACQAGVPSLWQRLLRGSGVDAELRSRAGVLHFGQRDRSGAHHSAEDVRAGDERGEVN